MTSQEPDIILYQNEKNSLYSNPLEGYFTLHPPRPPFQMTKTSNWRGYVATWEIVEDRIFLIELDGNIKGMGTFKMKDLFPESPKRVFADWINEIIKIPKGNQLHYVHMGYMSIYEQEILLTMEKGIVIKRLIIDNTKKDPKSIFDPPKPPSPPKL